MEGLTLSSNIDQLRDTFRRYAEWNQRDAAELFAQHSRKFATDLYMVTKDIAPTRAQIAADVKALGWRIPIKFKDGRLGRGYPAQWLGSALAKKQKKRGRKSNAAKASDEAFISFSHPTQRHLPSIARILFLLRGWTRRRALFARALGIKS